jgi:chromosome segregation protein
MFLRSLSIRGFKSFADKTTLEFAPGVSVIVGPNGSGKSNLVDAISWVLGEQGPRALRGGQMADVIFAGSPSRAALGMAEVKLVIDNSAGAIPVPMTEIEVSRSIFRSGDSEYRIGGQLCRLLDVQELLAETGIGRALHTVVGQGQLEDILSARPEDHRRYIEEAAGIAKHRRRKERAERKLAGLEQDVLRLRDVLSELRRQLKPLRQQAEMARRHDDLSSQADTLSAKLAAARLRELRAERERRSAGWSEGIERRTAARRRLDELDAQVAAAADERAAATLAVHEAEERFRSASGLRSGAERAYLEAVERESAARSELASEATRSARLAAVGDEEARLEAELGAGVADLVAREQELQEADDAFRAAERVRRDVEDRRRELAEEAAARRAEIATLRRSLATFDRDRARLEEVISTVRARIDESELERAGLREEVERLDARATPLAERKEGLEAERRTLTDRVADIEEAIRRHEARRKLLDARRSDIEETPGSRFLASHPGRAVGLLRDLVHADAGLERALASALGPLADAVVYDDGAAALADAPEGAGAILAASTGGPVAFTLPAERSLLSTVRADAPARGLVSTLLRDVYLASSIAEAADKHRRHSTASFVTAEGILVGPAVIHTSAVADDRVREIRAELSVIEHDLAAARASLRPRHQRLHALVAEAAGLDEQLGACDAGITHAAERTAALATELASLRKEEELLAQRLTAVDEAAAASRDGLASAAPGDVALPELPPVPEQPIRARVAVETLRRDRAAHEARLAALRAERHELSTHDPATLRAGLADAEAEHAEREEQLRAADSATDATEAARQRALAREHEATEAEAASNRAWREASGELDRLREAYEDDDRIRGELERRIRDAERLIRDGHGGDPEGVLASLADDDTIEALEKRAQLVQRRLGLLGRVNLLAGGEFEALQDRHDFLARELDDVRASRRDLLEVVGRIDDEITRTFDAAYRDVAAEFERLIAGLFPGGEGRLVLTDPSEPLTSGIEIEARPGRKRVKRISLLSGGERALTAMAFLFSIFRARPSPFYFMDEVEPALDDVNLHRFLRLVEGFASSSQVLIVTHQKRTMEIAGMLYGVSMSRDGTSKVISQRLETPEDGPEVAREAAAGARRGEERASRDIEPGERPVPVTVPEPDAVG